jgi:nucleoside-triphosphatase
MALEPAFQGTVGMLYVAVTGRPGVGKTTLFWKVVKRLQEDGVRVVGFYCPEVREAGVRVGFRIVALDGSVEAWLARRSGCDGPRVGRYNTCREAEQIARLVEERMDESDLIAIDEIGPMELKLPGVRRVIYKVFKAGKPGFFVVHERLSDPYILGKLRSQGTIFHVTVENRNTLVDEVYATVRRVLEGRAKAK